MAVKIRRSEARDRVRWGKLWDGYCGFYERDLSEPVERLNLANTRLTSA